jgi:Na+/proline symporter
MAIGSAVVLLHMIFGGMWSVALTDFLQMIIVVVGLSLIAWFAADLAGGARQVLAAAEGRHLFHFWPEPNVKTWLFWLSSGITLMVGSIPQQDVFQRVMGAKNAQIAVRGPVIGGVMYLIFAFVPMFIAVAAFVIMPQLAADLLKEDPQKILPSLVLLHMPTWLQVIFFGALLSAIMSTASATLLAPSTTFVENILKNFVPLTDRQELRAMRITLLVFAVIVLAYSIAMEGTSIYELVAMAYQFPVVGAFFPLVCGLYWKKSTTQGAIWSITLGMSAWGLLAFTPAGQEIPSVLGGFIMAGVGMWVGSLLPTQANHAHRARTAAHGPHSHAHSRPHAKHA